MIGYIISKDSKYAEYFDRNTKRYSWTESINNAKIFKNIDKLTLSKTIHVKEVNTSDSFILYEDSENILYFGKSEKLITNCISKKGAWHNIINHNRNEILKLKESIKNLEKLENTIMSLDIDSLEVY